MMPVMHIAQEDALMKKITQEEYNLIFAFWELLKKDIPELRERHAERTVIQWSGNLNKYKDKIGFYLESDRIQLYIRSGVEDKSRPPERTIQMKEYSRLIQMNLADQQPFYGKNQESEGRSIRVQKLWMRDDQTQWPHVAKWVKEQFVELQKIIVAKAEVNQDEYDLIIEFWELLKDYIPELPRNPAERRGTQWSGNLNKQMDKIGFFLGAGKIQLYIRSGVEDKSEPPERTRQMNEYSQLIRMHLANQQPFYGKNQERKGRSVRVQRLWVLNDKEQWPHAAQWIKEMFVALQEIIVSMK